VKPPAVRHFDARFRTLGTAARAAGSKAYMKSALRFHGVDAAQVRGEATSYYKAEPARDALVADATALFATDAFDLRSVAIALLERNEGVLSARDLPWLIGLARAGACWAHVDFLVTKVIGPILERTGDVARWSRTWAADEDFWIRRVALLGQLRPLRRGGGDFALFTELAVPMLPEREFFIRKAIGWILREVSKRRPVLVRDFLVEHGAACSGVTWREAIKYLPPRMRSAAERALTHRNRDAT
jgi:3-methyladenine DNA glycosylase AlkD